MIASLKLPRRSQTPRPAIGARSGSLLERSLLAFRRYVLLSTGIASTAVGLALIVSFVAATYGPSSAEEGVDVARLGERYRAGLLDSTLGIAGPEFSSTTAGFEAAIPAPALSFENRPPTPPASAVERPVIGEIRDVNITFYDCYNQGFCGDMYNGEPVFEGAAACSWDLPIGTQFVIEEDPTGRVYVCADRGILPDTWVDIFFYSPNDGWAWQSSVGRHATIRIIHLPAFTPS